MSVSWSVFPIVPEVVEWLKKYDLTLPEGESRWATLNELMIVLEAFDVPIQRQDHNNGEYPSVTILLGTLDSAVFAQISGTLKPDHLEFSFDYSGNQGHTMLTILQKLSKICGAQVIFSGTGNKPKPLIVTPERDIDQALKTWWYR